MAKPAFFLYSGDGSGIPLALRLKREGHPVTLYIKSEEARDMGTGLLPKTTRPEPPAGAIVIFDCTKFGAAGREFRKQGHPVIGGNPFERDLELDRPAGAALMRQAGIRVPETHPFRSYGAAISFLREHEGKWFVKVSADTVESATYDAPDSASMIRYLSWIEEKGGKVDPFELQRRVEGAEVSLNGWFDGTRFVRPFDLTMEEKRFLTGEHGPRTGCESNIVWHARGEELAEDTLIPLEARLEREGYVGLLDLNMKLEDGKPWGLEWTARLGWDATEAWMRLVEPLGEQLDAFAHGSLEEWTVTPGIAMTLRVSIPPYPTWDTRLIGKTSGLPLDPRVADSRDIDPVDVMVKNGKPVAAGGSGIICTVGAVGTDVPKLRTAVVKRAAALTIPSAQFRTDPVSRWERDWPAVKVL